MNPVSEAAPRPATDPIAADPHRAVGRTPARRPRRPPSSPRRGFLRGAALTGGGLMAVTLAACAPGTPTPGWTFGPIGTPAPAGAPTASPAPTPVPSAAASAAPTPAASGSIPPGWTSHDIDARNVVRRYVGNLAPGPPGHLRRRGVREARRHPRRRRRLPRAVGKKPAFVQVPQLVLNDAPAARSRRSSTATSRSSG